MKLNAKSVSDHPMHVPNSEVVIVPHDYIGLATALRMRQEKRIRLTFICSTCTTYLEASGIARTLCICPYHLPNRDKGRRRPTAA